MKILIIGANGFLGRHLALASLQKRWNVHCVYNKNKNNIPKTCKTFTLNEIFNANNSYDIIFLVAAKIPGNNIQMDKLITSNLELPLRIAKKYKNTKIVFSSSVSVFGSHKKPISEFSSYNNPSAYGLSKLAGEFALKNNNNYTIIRFSSIYGKGMSNKTFIPRVLAQARKGLITLYGKGERLQNYIHINDAVNLCLLAGISNKNGVYLGVSKKSYSNLKTAKIIMGYFPNCKLEFSGPDDSFSFIYDNSFTEKTLNYKTKYSLEEGLKDLIEND